MKKKQYISPRMESVHLDAAAQLMFGSNVGAVTTDGLDNDGDENLLDETPQNIWDEAW